MTRPENSSWEFVKQGRVFQYKEDSLIAMVFIEEDNSDDEFYSFRVKPLAANMDIGPEAFTVSHARKIGGIYSGMAQFYEKPEYIPLPIGKPWPFFWDKEWEFLKELKEWTGSG